MPVPHGVGKGCLAEFPTELEFSSKHKLLTFFY